MMDEEFKKIDECDNYSVSNLSRVRNDETGTFIKGCKNSRGYLVIELSNNGIPKMFSIHRLVGLYFIENVNNYEIIDHINRDRLDNCVDNLRWATSSQNNANRGKKQNATSIYIGVSFYKPTNKWCSKITINKKPKYLGYFLTEIEANDARQNYILDKNLQEFYN
jgi:hypothetical protein